MDFGQDLRTFHESPSQKISARRDDCNELMEESYSFSTIKPSEEKGGRDGAPFCIAVGSELHFLDAVDEGLQLAAAAGVTELAQCLRLYLTDAFMGHLKGLPTPNGSRVRCRLRGAPVGDETSRAQALRRRVQARPALFARRRPATIFRSSFPRVHCD